MKLDDCRIDEFENRLRVVEGELEGLGRTICDAEGGAESWREINESLDHIRQAVRKSYLMR